MSAFGRTIYDRLVADSSIKAVVDINIFPEYRSEFVPSLVYDVRVESVDGTYEGKETISYEITVSAIADTYKAANELADFVIANLDYVNWADSAYRILGAFFKGRDESILVQAGKNKRLTVVDLRFDVVATRLT